VWHEQRLDMMGMIAEHRTLLLHAECARSVQNVLIVVFSYFGIVFV